MTPEEEQVQRRRLASIGLAPHIVNQVFREYAEGTKNAEELSRYAIEVMGLEPEEAAVCLARALAATLILMPDEVKRAECCNFCAMGVAQEVQHSFTQRSR